MKPASPQDRFAFERQLHQQGWSRLAGLDEAGRGPLAGPVVAAAVCLPKIWVDAGLPEPLRGLNDSKQLTARQRDHFFAFLTSSPEVRFGIAFVGAARIDEINILQATYEAMNLALDQLQPAPDQVLVDGLPVPTLHFPQRALVRGDSLSYSIAAASVLAKVTRDRRMIELEAQYPQYGFAQHKGYGTPQHLAALAKLGPSPLHRRSFTWQKPVQKELFPPRA